MYACMSACIYACMYACVYPCMRICMHLCMHACMRVCMYARMHVCKYVYRVTQKNATKKVLSNIYLLRHYGNEYTYKPLVPRGISRVKYMLLYNTFFVALFLGHPVYIITCYDVLIGSCSWRTLL